MKGGYRKRIKNLLYGFLIMFSNNQEKMIPEQDYNEVLEDLTNLLNSRKAVQNLSEKIKEDLKILKVSFGQIVSKNFLRDLIEGTKKHKRDRLNYIMAKSGLFVVEGTKWSRVWKSDKYKIQVTDYTNENGKVYLNDVELNEDEKEFLRIKEETARLQEEENSLFSEIDGRERGVFDGLELKGYPYAFRPIEEQKSSKRTYKKKDDEMRLSSMPYVERENLRQAINRGGKPIVVYHKKDFTEQEAGKTFMGQEIKTFNFIGGF